MIDIEEIIDIERDLRKFWGIEETEEDVMRGTFKITNKTFQPIQLILEDGSMLLLGARKNNNIVFVKKLTKQIENLEIDGFVKIRKM